MNPKSFLAALLCLLVFSGSSFAANCRFQNQKQQQDCLKQEQARQQAEAQRQQQLQQQQAQQRQQQEAQRQAQLRQQQEAQRQQQLQQQQSLQRQQQQQTQQRAQEQARQAEAQRQQLAAQKQAEAQHQKEQEAKRQQQLQQQQALQQQALQRQQEQQRPKPVPTPTPQSVPPKAIVTIAKPTVTPAPAVSRTAGMSPVILGNGQQVFVNAQGAFFDASGSPISNQSVANARKGTPAIAPTPAPQVVPSNPAPMGPVGTASSRAQEQARQAEAQRQQQQEAQRKDQLQQQQALQRQQAQQQPKPALTTAKPSVTPTSTPSRAAGMTPIILGNGQQAFVNAQGAFFDASGNPIPNQSVASATKGTRSITPTLAPRAVAPKSAPTTTPAAQSRSASDPAKGSPSTVGPPSTKELERYGVEQLAAMPKEQLVNLSADRRKHLDVYLSAKADTAKYKAEANRSVASRFVEELPRQSVNVAAGAAVGAGQVAVETGKSAFDAGRSVGTAIAHPRETIHNAAQEVAEIKKNPREVAREVGSAISSVATHTGQALSSGATNYVGAVKRGDGYEAGRVVGRTAASTGLALGGAGAARIVTRAESAIIQSAERKVVKDAVTKAPAAANQEIIGLAKTQVKNSVPSSPATKEIGGAYKDLKKPAGDGLDAHHCPAGECFKKTLLSSADGPAIKMDPKDHARTASYGNSEPARLYRERQVTLVKEGKLQEALEMDIRDIRNKFGNKYDEHIKQMVEYAKTVNPKSLKTR